MNEPDVDLGRRRSRFAGEDEFGRFAWVKLAPNASQVGFIVHKGDTKDPDGSPDRFFDPQQTPEIWLKSGDATVYTSRAAAQGYVELRYHRPDGVYTGWGLHLWGDAIDPTEATEWTAPKLPDRIDDYGAHWLVRIQDATKAVNFIVHKGDEKDTAEDRSFVPAEKPSVWLQSGDSTVYATRGDAEDFALIHYHRDDGDYGDPTSPDFNDFWGLHVWDGSAETGVTWQTPVRPIGRDGFGLVFKVRLVDGAARLAYIVHRGDTKDPGPDQFLDLDALGHEVWILSGHVDADNNTKYLLPMIGGPGVDADLDKAKAHWLDARHARLERGARGRWHVPPQLLPDRRPRRRARGCHRRRVDPALPGEMPLRRAEGEVAAPGRLQRVPDQGGRPRPRAGGAARTAGGRRQSTRTASSAAPPASRSRASSTTSTPTTPSSAPASPAGRRRCGSGRRRRRTVQLRLGTTLGADDAATRRRGVWSVDRRRRPGTARSTPTR